MSDYLSNLVDRSLDRADVIQPRLPSLFEPAQGIGNPIAGLWQDAEPTTETIEQPVPEARTQRSVARQPSPISRIFDRVINRRSPESDSNPQFPSLTEMIEQPVPEARTQRSEAGQPSPISRIFDRVINRRSPESDSNPQFPSLSARTDTIEVSQPRFQPPPEIARTETVDRAEPTPDPSAVIQPLSLQQQITAQHIVPGDFSVEQPEIASQTILDQERPLDVTINHLDRMLSPNHPPISVQDSIARIEPPLLPTDVINSHNPQRGQTMEGKAIEQLRSVIQSIEPDVITTPDRSMMPTIHVMIGRIEVRATTAPATLSAKTARSQLPVMGLDEYLHQRGGGK
jgi:hypothetical protein